MSRPAEIEIDLSALVHNVGCVSALCGDSKIVAVVKADAYGHGAAEVARRLESCVSMFAVSCVEEALTLRGAGIEVPILLLEGCFSDSEWAIASANNFQVVIHNQRQLTQLESARLAMPIKLWVKVDTGMHRLGVEPGQAQAFVSRVTASANADGPPVVISHFASADEPGNPLTETQLAAFVSVLADVQERCQLPSLQASMANSAALMSLPQSHYQWVRPGVMLYGLSPFHYPHPTAEQLRPAMTLRSEVTAVRQIPTGDTVGYGNRWRAQRDSIIATIAVGYGDGYPRNAEDGTPVWVKGETVPLVGRVSMDMITVDVTDHPSVAIGDAVELWGSRLSVNRVAEHSDTIGYELVTRMPPRVPKRFIG